MKKPAKKKNGISKNENEKYYRYIIENSEEAILLTRPDGTVEYANPEACKLFGRTEEEICNLGRNGIIDLNDPRLHIALEGRKRTGKFKGELNFVKKDGTIFPAEISSIIFKDEDGNERTSMVIRDITEEKEAVTKTQLLAHTITSITEIISITDLNDRFTFVNQAFCDIYGYTYEEIIGQHVKILVSPNNPPELLKNVLKHSHKDTWKGEILNLTKDGREFPISLQTSQIKNDKGEIIGLVGISEDITEQKRIEEVLRESEDRFRLLFERSAEAQLLLDDKGKVADCNNALLRLFALRDKETILGHGPDEFAPELQPNGTPSKDFGKIIYAKVLENGYAQFEWSHFKHNPERTPILNELICTLIPIQGRSFLHVAIRDITVRKKAEIALEESEYRFKTLSSLSNEGIMIHDKGVILDVNLAFARLLGYSNVDDLIGKDGFEITQLTPESKQNVLHHSQTNSDDTYEIELLNLNGKLISAETRASETPYKGINARIVYMRDISERKQADQSIRESEEKFKTVFEEARDGILIADIETKKFLTGNKMICQMLGYDEEEIRKIGIGDIHPENDLPYVLEQVEKQMKNEIHIAKDLPCKRKDGSIFYADVNAVPIIIKGKTYLLSIFRDITERKRAEETLRKSHDLLDTTFASLNDAVFILDDQAVVVECNRAASLIFGYRQDEIQGQTTAFLHVDESALAEFRQELYSAIEAEGRLNQFEFRMKRRDGTIFATEHSVIPLVNVQGRSSGWVSVVRDISERKQAEEKLQESEELLSLYMKFSPIYSYIKEVTPTESRVLKASENFKDMIGIAGSEMVGKTMEELYPAEFAVKISADDWNVVSYGKTITINEEFNGRYYTTTKYPIMQGEKKLLAGHTIDITDRKKAEIALEESEYRFKTLSSLSNEGIMIHDEGVILDVNLAFARLLGYSNVDELIGKDGFEITQLTPESKQNVLRHFQTKSKDTYEIELLNLNGELISAETWGSKILYKGINARIVYMRDISERKKAEEKISMLAYAIRSISECVCITDMEDNILFVNKAFLKTYKYEEHELIGNNISIIRSPNNPLDIVHQILPLTIQGGWNGELLNIRKDGTEFPVFLSTSVIRDDTGNPVALIGITSDITERKRAEEEMNKLANVVSHSSELVNLATIDGKMIFLNEAGIKMLGISAAEVEQTNIMQVIPTHLKEMVENELFPTLLNTGRWIGDLQYLNLKTSQLIDVHATTFAIKDQKTGVPLYFANVSSDITERKKAEEALKKSELKYRNLIETMPEGFYRSTPEGYFVDVNPAFIKMLGYDSKEELMKVNIPNELYFTYNERIDGVTYNVDFIPDTEVYRLKKKDGSEIWVEDHSRYIQDISGKILYHEGIMRDFTESLHAQKAIIEAKEKAEEANRLKSSFLANMSHEIRTPLSGIVGFADILKVELKDPAHIKYADIIEKSGNRLLETLDLILSFSKLEAEKEDAHYSNVRIEDVIDEVLKSFEAAAKNKNLFLKLSVQNKKLITYIDERFLRQIMNNLINNAIKYTDAGGITVNLLKENNNVVIKIIDTGIGIAKNKQEIIFQEFRQESEGHGRSFEGTGLGLAITKRFVELMKGKIEVESEVGIGSVFTVKFPYKNAPETITIKIKKEKPKKEIIMPVLPDKDKLSVLLVENDMMNLDFTVTVLNEYYNIETAVDGPEAIEKAKNKIHDIILMDINLGKGMDGIEAVRKIRKLPGYSKTPVVALTAFTLPGDREEFIAGGCTHYLGKPFTRNQMLELLKNISVKI